MTYKKKLVPLEEKETLEISESFLEFYRIIKTLRAPHGCPWDRKQTASSLSPNLIEEVYELIDAIENRDIANQQEELGDILLVTTMISAIREEEQEFTLSDILREVSEKLVRRHPHVFGDVKKEDPDEVVELWNHIKKTVEHKQVDEKESIFDKIPRTMPPLERAYKIQKKAAKVGFDWENIQEVFGKLQEEIVELQDCLEAEDDLDSDTAPSDSLENEVGDVLFSIINISRYLKIDPAIALNKTNKKFLSRFSHIEEEMERSGLSLAKENFEKMDDLWDEAKNKGL